MRSGPGGWRDRLRVRFKYDGGMQALCERVLEGDTMIDNEPATRCHDARDALPNGAFFRVQSIPRTKVLHFVATVASTLGGPPAASRSR